MSVSHYHVFIPGLFAPLRLWQRDFAFEPQSAALMRLLASAHMSELPVTGLERSLLHWLGIDVNNQLPWAQLRHAFESGGMYQPPLLCADPVSLQSGSNGVILQPELPLLTRDETERLFADLNAHLALDGLVLKAFHPQRWYLHALDDRFSTPLPTTTPLSEVGAGNIFSALPQADTSSKYWHQLLNEIQMLLHNHAVNQVRENSGQLPVNGVWFWGEGEASHALSEIEGKVVQVQGGGLVGQTLAAAVKASWQEKPSASDMSDGNTLVILDQLQSAVTAEQPQRWQQALDGMDDYFVFLHEVLQAGGGVSLYDAAGKSFYCEHVAGWQFWRRQRAQWDAFI